ncbi:unnamed protein product [Phytomonas sp. EM1]|nr:unnamed protein product [Phytomonas sp. EM1]|eukprot:CCW65041.1 unnamed protein product [Phytomonas sp. isolate EM1]
MLLWLYYTNDSSGTSLTPSVLRSGGTQDIFVRSTGPRVVIFIMSNEFDDSICYSVGSAYLSGLPVVVAGYQMLFENFLSKFDFMEAAIGNAELQPEDVVIAMNSATIFMGDDINPFLDRFIAQSAATPEELDVVAVRQGRAMAPLFVGAEAICWARDVFDYMDNCKTDYETVYSKVRKYAAAYPEHELSLPFDLSPQRHLSSGVVVARVWAYKEFLQKAKNFTRTQTPRVNPPKGWRCDQSVYTSLYLDHIAWEVERDVFSMPSHERQGARSPYGVRAGFIGLDFVNVFSGYGELDSPYTSEMHDEHWAKYLPADGLKHSHSNEVTVLWHIGLFVGRLYRRAYAAHGDGIFTKLALPRWDGGRRVSGEFHIALTPPLWAIKLRPIDTVGNTTRHSYPLVFHAADDSIGYAKLVDMDNGAVGARWSVPMARNPEARRQAMEYLASVPLFLSTSNSIIRDSYHAKCVFPFDRMIETVQYL